MMKPDEVAELSPLAQDVLALLRYESRWRGYCWHGPHFLAKALCADRGECEQALNELLAAGAVRRLQQAWVGSPKTTPSGRLTFPAGYQVYAYEPAV
jgi:hypothetical protein